MGVWMSKSSQLPQTKLVCVCDKTSLLVTSEKGLVCSRPECPHADSENAFPMFSNVPIIISETVTDTVCSVANTQSYVPRSATRLHTIAKFLRGTSELSQRNCDRFIAAMRQNSDQPRVLVIGSGTRGAGTNALWEHPDLSLVGTDIYVSPNVDVVCDAHYLPFPAETFDGVWIQAVLEHVVEPIEVVAELERVLKTDGIVYAETPFMQQVHEGAYDFTRYTVLGHRYLFRKFEAIDFGGNKGAEVGLAWSMRYFTWAVFRSRFLAQILGLLAGVLLKPFRYLTSKESLFDSPAGVYFLGKKAVGYQLSHAELILLYRGSQ